MRGARTGYFFLIIVIIILGLLSRKFSIIPLWVGDVLWATMIFFMVRFLYIRAPVKKIAVISLAVCYAIEFGQLYKAEWIDNIRHMLFGRLFLGEVFLWGDLVSYTAGILIGIIIDVYSTKGGRAFLP